MCVGGVRRRCQSSLTFLDGDSRYFAAFDEVGQLSRMQSALQSDHRMAQWMPKLVPRKSDTPHALLGCDAHTRTHSHTHSHSAQPSHPASRSGP